MKSADNDIERLINRIKRGLVCPSDIPEDLENHIDIIRAERKYGYRMIGNRGYDVIRNAFFVEEKSTDYKGVFSGRQTETKWFTDFHSYYDYVEGEIYENACYYKWDYAGINIKIDKSKIENRKSLIDYDIDTYTKKLHETERQQYNKTQRNKINLKKWLDKFLNCDSLESFSKTAKSYEKSAQNTDISFFIWNYLSLDFKDKKRLDIILRYLASHSYGFQGGILEPLCLIYNPEDVLRYYDYPGLYSKTTMNKHRKEIKKYIDQITLSAPKLIRRAGFDEKTHYYYAFSGDSKNYRWARSSFDVEMNSRREYEYGLYRFFETFDDLVKFLNYDLDNTDLSKDLSLEFDFSTCKVTESTKLPLTNMDGLHYSIYKEYKNAKFVVWQEWVDDNNVLIDSISNEFVYFFDFVAFMKGDLSNSDLITCEGLTNLKDPDGISFEGALLPSFIGEKLGLPQPEYKFKPALMQGFELATVNEKETGLVYQEKRPNEDNNNFFSRVFYVTDIHLLHRLEQINAVTKVDIIYCVRKIIDSLLQDKPYNILLIAGDTSSDINIFIAFVKCLRYELDDRCLSHRLSVIFTLGNHELWEFSDKTIDEITEVYKKVLSQYDMHLLQNCILYKTHDVDSLNKVQMIDADELLIGTKQDLREKLREAKTILFGGLAFSGYNNEFNADDGIYRNAINRIQEIEETRTFESLYKKVLDCLPDKQVIIATHTPLQDWSNKADYHTNYVYVSGHTHRNFFYDDGETRVYADNQVGYFADSVFTKWLEIDGMYDYFSDYSDGIYSVSKDEYKAFYRGKNLYLTINRDFYQLYMLKKNGYYCFIAQSEKGKLSMLNGGSITNLSSNDINYYYDSMDSVIQMIKHPLDKYTEYQRRVADEVVKIGGSGRIHGCIIDIDPGLGIAFNHLFVNPFDLTITAYWASDIIYKKVYSNTRTLLEKQCPLLYKNYLKILDSNKDNLPVLANNISSSKTKTQYEYSTVMYKASREIRKMQKLELNILTTWNEGALESGPGLISGGPDLLKDFTTDN